MDWRKDIEGFTLFSVPKASSSKNSKSLYLGIKECKDRAFVLQYLPRNSTTSIHYHEEITEIHTILFGGCYIRRGGESKPLEDKEKTGPKEPHSLETKEEDCLILLEIIHNGKRDWKEDKILV
jgi:hypothetical protein